MKHLASLLLVGVLALGVRTVRAQSANGNTDLNKGEAPVGLFGHTPVPTPAKASGPKKPLEASLALDEKGTGTGTTFAKNDAKIYLLVKDYSGAKGDKIRAVWIADDTGGALPKGRKLNDFTQTLTQPAQNTTFFTQVSGGFPPGKYQADLYENSTLVKSLKFTVKK